MKVGGKTDMAARGLDKVLEHLSRVDKDGHRDGPLLARFLANRDEAAFTALVRRHGPMVFGVCRRVLGNIHDAEDAFQATFLVLARKAASVVKQEALASWLYAVAYRTALEAKRKASKRRAWERQVEKMPHPEVAPPEAQDWRPVLDRELNHLPEKYRAPLVLCELEGKTRREAARQLGLSEGTLSSRLARGRCLLARRLAKCGLSLSGGALATAIAEGASAVVPTVLVRATVQAVMVVAAGQAAAVATPAVALMNEVLKAMLMTKARVTTALALAVALLGGGALVYQAAGQDRPVETRAAARPLTEVEILQREVAVLKLQMEILQEKVRTQGEEMRSLRGRVGGTPGGKGPGTPGMGGTGQPGSTSPVPVTTPSGFPPATSEVPVTLPDSPVPAGSIGVPPARTAPVPASAGLPTDGSVTQPNAFLPPGAVTGPPTRPSPVPDVVQEVEAALKALRQASDDTARQRAMDRLEKAMSKLRKQARKQPPGEDNLPPKR
jgi:RNA polymerase sigma factor (sigma-70 family)